VCLSGDSPMVLMGQNYCVRQSRIILFLNDTICAFNCGENCTGKINTGCKNFPAGHREGTEGSTFNAGTVNFILGLKCIVMAARAQIPPGSDD
jgi:hypothetical protein